MSTVLAKVLCIVVTLCALGVVAPRSTAAAEWTVMVYLNAKNNLEPDGIDNFYDMSSIGSTADVNVVVQMGRPKEHYDERDEAWSGVMRFLVKKGTKPRAGEALQDLAKDGENTDMGSPETLARFIEWSMSKFPAKRYFVIVWNHGQGWRFQLAKDRNVKGRAAASRGQQITADERKQLEALTARVPPLGGFRSVSHDEDTGSILYNRQIQTVLESKFSGRQLELLGFDACLMSMVETAYAFRRAAAVMVASEELEPTAGWPYKAWLAALIKDPTKDAPALGKLVVDAYRDRYGNDRLTTLSSIRLSEVHELGQSISTLGRSMKDNLLAEANIIADVRSQVRPYGQQVRLKTSIDLQHFLDLYQAKTGHAAIRSAIEDVKTKLASVVLANYRSKQSDKPYGSHGLAIYFPASRKDFLDDPNSSGYQKNAEHPVEFVENEAWGDFLRAYLK